MTKEQKDKLLKEIIIRFDTNPRFYQKDDYSALLKLITELLANADESQSEIEAINQIINQQGLIDIVTREEVEQLVQELNTQINQEVVLDWTPNTWDHI